jgi:hypothetical protein
VLDNIPGPGTDYRLTPGTHTAQVIYLANVASQIWSFTVVTPVCVKTPPRTEPMTEGQQRVGGLSLGGGVTPPGAPSPKLLASTGSATKPAIGIAVLFGLVGAGLAYTGRRRKS